MFDKTKRVARNFGKSIKTNTKGVVKKQIADYKRRQLDKGYDKYKRSTKDSDFEIQRGKSDIESGKNEMSNRATNAQDRLNRMGEGTSPLGRSRKLSSDKLQESINKYGGKTTSQPRTAKRATRLPGKTGRVVGIPKQTRKQRITRSVTNEARKRREKANIGR